MMPIIDDICAAIRRQPQINRVVVSEVELETIRLEFAESLPVRSAPRPTYGGLFGDIDRFLWDELEGMMKRAPVQIMGRPVMARQ